MHVAGADDDSSTLPSFKSWAKHSSAAVAPIYGRSGRSAPQGYQVADAGQGCRGWHAALGVDFDFEEDVEARCGYRRLMRWSGERVGWRSKSSASAVLLHHTPEQCTPPGTDSVSSSSQCSSSRVVSSRVPRRKSGLRDNHPTCAAVGQTGTGTLVPQTCICHSRPCPALPSPAGTGRCAPPLLLPRARDEGPRALPACLPAIHSSFDPGRRESAVYPYPSSPSSIQTTPECVSLSK